MDDWSELNKLMKDVHLHPDDSEDQKIHLKLLIERAKENKDPNYIKELLRLNDIIKRGHAKDTIQWLTSKVNGNFYPPIQVDQAGPLAWNQPDVAKLCTPPRMKLTGNYTSLEPLKLYLDVDYICQCPDINDCSLVACIINIRQKRAEFSAIKELRPNVYVTNLCFNGSSLRLVTVDVSSIPTTSDGKQLSIRSPHLEDKVIELAYLQVFSNSYDTSGSNTAIDTFRLTGYLPEVISASDCDISMLYKYSKSEYCLLAAGTSNNKKMLTEPLLPNHDYSFIDVDRDLKKIVLRDPLDHELLIRLDFNSFQKYFSQVYLNWDHRNLFKSVKVIHIFYSSEKYNKFRSLVGKPIFDITNYSSDNEIVWLLLESHINNNRTESDSVSYLEEVPTEGIFQNRYTKKAVDVGLQLTKIELKASETRKFFLHSNNTKSFTIHVYSNTEHISIKRGTPNRSISTENFSFDKSYQFISNRYYLNPTFKLIVESDSKKEILIDLFVISENPQNTMNLQLYNKDDISLLKPIQFSNHYADGYFAKENFLLTPNHEYQLIFSCTNLNTLSNFKLIGVVKEPDTGKRIQFSRIYNEYGSLPFQIKQTIIFQPNQMIKKLELSSKLANTAFVRLVPMGENNVSSRLIIMDNDQKVRSRAFSVHGSVISDINVNSNSHIDLLIEIERCTTNICFQILIGSQRNINVSISDTATSLEVGVT